MAEIARRTKRYPADLTDEEWQRIKPLLPAVPRRGRKPMTDLREALNAIRYMARSGDGWRMLPKDFPPSGKVRSRGVISAQLAGPTVYWWSRRFGRRLLFRTIHDVALMLDRGGPRSQPVWWHPRQPIGESATSRSTPMAGS